MTWAKNTIWWSVYPLGACGAPIRTPDTSGVHHRLARLEAWLDHVIELGCNGLALGPVWASSTHGYDIEDHSRIDPRLGDDQDFDHLVAACHGKGIRVLLDGVFNHVSADHQWVHQVLRNGWADPAARMLKADPADAQGLARFEGHAGLVELDHSHPEVGEYAVRIMNQWLDRGADGWRLDAAYRVPKPFWVEVLPRVRNTHPDAWFMAEILHGDYAAIADETSVDSITQYELWKAIWSCLKDNNPHELMWALQRNEKTLGHEVPWTFISNHDVTRISSQVGEKLALMALGILMSVPGVPAIYYGDEWGWTGCKEEREGGDDALRPALPDQPRPLTSQEAETQRITQLAIRVRHTHPWLVTGSTTILHSSYDHLSWRTVDGDNWVQAELTAGPVQSLVISDMTGELLRF